jgi:hypothetical protein
MFPIKSMPETNNSENSASNSRPRSASQKIIAFAFRRITALWPSDSRDWALAMQAELPQMESTQQSLQWLAGGIMSLGKAWWNGAISSDNKKDLAPVKKPGILAISLALVALGAFFLMPSVHEGFSAVAHSWNSRGNWNQTSYQGMAREAEANHDAKTLAYLSARMNTPEENARLADEAVSLDPSLTWIYIKGAGSNYVYTQIPEKRAWMSKLEASDPDNAMPYLMQAAVRSNEIFYANNLRISNELLIADPAWRADMEKSFAAPRYDSYYDRGMDLQQAVLKAHNLRDPEDVSLGISESYGPGLGQAQTYSKLLLKQAKDAQQKGDTATATHLAWTILQFIERTRPTVHGEYTRISLDSTTQSACAFLQPLEAAAGHADVAKLLASQNATLTKRLAEKNPYYATYLRRQHDGTGTILHSSAAGLLLFGSAILLSALVFLVARFVPLRREGVAYRWACNCLRFAPAGFAAATALMALTFAPYLNTVNDYLNGMRAPATIDALISVEYSLYQFPNRIFNPLNQAMYASLLRAALLVVVIIAGALFLGRNVSRPRTSRIGVA